eukprot:1189232-Prorocentrum_minimum.AAC.5
MNSLSFDHFKTLSLFISPDSQRTIFTSHSVTREAILAIFFFPVSCITAKFAQYVPNFRAVAGVNEDSERDSGISSTRPSSTHAKMIKLFSVKVGALRVPLCL